MALGPYEPVAGIPQLETGGGMNGVVDAAVAGMKTAQEGAVGRIDDGVGPQAGDIAPPQRQMWVGGADRQRHLLHHALFRPLCTEQCILDAQEILLQRHGRPQIHQAAQKAALGGRVRWKAVGLLSQRGHILEKTPDQVLYALLFIHLDPSGPEIKGAESLRPASAALL